MSKTIITRDEALKMLSGMKSAFGSKPEDIDRLIRMNQAGQFRLADHRGELVVEDDKRQRMAGPSAPTVSGQKRKPTMLERAGDLIAGNPDPLETADDRPEYARTAEAMFAPAASLQEEPTDLQKRFMQAWIDG